jgi:hypothetical protein
VGVQQETATPRPANLEATAIFDFRSREVESVAARIVQPPHPPAELLRAAHRHLAGILRPAYSVRELQPVSRTLRAGKASCSQSMACLEALARHAGIATRVRALWMDGRFWYPRFKYTRPFIPHRILLLWPQFCVRGKWTDAGELYGIIETLAGTADHGFRNDGETLFQLVEHTHVDFFGKSCTGGCRSDFDLSRFVLEDEGLFDTRDEAFARHRPFELTFRGRAFEALYGGRFSSAGTVTRN